jgi:hypothetical protein
MNKRALLPLVVLPPLLAACAAPIGPDKPATHERVGQAVSAPLSDLNLVKADIPVVLQVAVKAPYALPEDASCPALIKDVQLLDAVLGADLDKPPTEKDPSLVARGSGAAEDAAFDALRRTAEGVVPFRGWIRKLSGAERYSREVQAAIAAGTIRRAFLKGLGQAHGCEAPAAPRVPIPPKS